MAKLINVQAFDADGMTSFLKMLDQIQLVAIHKSRPDVHAKYFGEHAEAAVDWAQAKNANGFGIYYSANRVRNGFDQKPKKSDIVSCRMCHVDIDPPRGAEHDFSVAATIETLECLNYPPSYIVSSGNGLQAAWLLDGDYRNIEAVERVNMQIRGMFSADACQDVSRLLRVPGAVNHPSLVKEARGRKPVMASMVGEPTGALYELEELSAFFPPAEITEAAERALVEVSDYELLTADDLALTPFHPLRRALEKPKGDDRSAYGYHAACEAVREHLTDSQIAGLLLNPANQASAHFLDQEHPLRAVKRAIGRARGVEEIEEPEAPPPEIDFSRLVANSLAKAVVRNERTTEIVEDKPEGSFDWYTQLRGGMKEMVDTILYAAPNPRPELALGAAISLFATAAGRRYQSPSGILTNIYCVGLMSSGAGKDFPLRSVGQVLTLAQLEDCVGGRIVSATGIRSALERNPVLFIPIDEFGKLIQAMNAKHGPLRDAVSMMLELYSEAQSFAKGGMYANTQERATVLIRNPCMSFMGVATPSSFWGGLTRESVADGFLPRMILLNDETPDSRPDRTRAMRKAVWGDGLIGAVKRVREGAEGHNAFTMGDGSTTPCNPYIVNFANDEANDLWWQMKDEEYEYRQRLPENVHAFANRLAENATKLALTKAISENPARPILRPEDVAWGRAISKRSIDMFLSQTEKHLSENEQEAKVKRVLQLIRDAGGAGMPVSVIGQRLQGLAARDRQAILEDLTDQGLIRFEKEATSGRPRITYFAAG